MMINLAQRRMPDGRVSWRMIRPSRPQIAIHQSMIAHAQPSVPRMVHVPMQILLWLKWVTWHGWFSVARASNAFGASAEAAWGFSRWQQWRRLVRLSIGSGLPPDAAYQFGILARPEAAWDYVADAQVAAWHQWQNGKRAGTAQQMAGLADKVEAGRSLSKVGVPMAPVHDIMAKSDALGLTEQALVTMVGRHGTLFCKARAGQRGLGSFECWIGDGGLAGRLFEGDDLPTTAAVMAAWRSLAASDDVLVQPLLRNHPLLAPLATDGTTITVRCVTQRRADGIIAKCGALEIPLRRRSAGHSAAYILLPIAMGNGVPQPLPASPCHTAEQRERQREILGRWPVSHPLPGWDALIAHSIAAHAQFPDLWAIAWDWVMTPEGPVLLEGNSGFSGTMPQIMCGGFLTWAES